MQHLLFTVNILYTKEILTEESLYKALGPEGKQVTTITSHICIDFGKHKTLKELV